MYFVSSYFQREPFYMLLPQNLCWSRCWRLLVQSLACHSWAHSYLVRKCCVFSGCPVWLDMAFVDYHNLCQSLCDYHDTTHRRNTWRKHFFVCTLNNTEKETKLLLERKLRNGKESVKSAQRQLETLNSFSQMRKCTSCWDNHVNQQVLVNTWSSAWCSSIFMTALIMALTADRSASLGSMSQTSYSSVLHLLCSLFLYRVFPELPTALMDAKPQFKVSSSDHW